MENKYKINIEIKIGFNGYKRACLILDVNTKINNAKYCILVKNDKLSLNKECLNEFCIANEKKMQSHVYFLNEKLFEIANKLYKEKYEKEYLKIKEEIDKYNKHIYLEKRIKLFVNDVLSDNKHKTYEELKKETIEMIEIEFNDRIVEKIL